MGQIPNTCGGVSHEEKEKQFTIVPALPVEARMSFVSERSNVGCVCRFQKGEKAVK